MSWLFAQTWLWYLIAFAVGVLLAWLLLVLPQQRRLRTLESVAGAGIDHDLYADSRRGVGAATGGATLFDPGPGQGDGAAEPTTEQFPVVGTADPDPRPAQPAADDSETGEIPVVSDVHAEADEAGDPPAGAGTEPNPESGATTDAETGAAVSAGGSTGAGAASNGHSPSAARADADPTGSPTGAVAVASAVGGAAAVGASRRAAPAAIGSAEEPAPAGDATSIDESAADPDGTGPIDVEGDGTGPDPGASSSGAADTPETADAAAATEPGAGAQAQGLLGAAAAFSPGRYPGSARPGPDGAAPSDEFTIKGNEDSMLFHTPESPYFTRTKAEVWFSTPADAEAAGFTSWTRKK